MKRANKPLPDGPSWTFSDIKDYMDVLGELSESEYGLDIYTNQIEVVSSQQMLDAYAFTGLPTCYHHWRNGKSFAITQGAYRKGQTNLAYEMVINSNPCISYFMEENNLVTQALVAAHACLSGDTQYLSRTGWRRLDQYDGEEVGQYNEDGTVSFVLPEKYIVNYNVDWLYEIRTERGIVQKLTPDHRVAYLNWNSPTPQFITMEELKERHERNAAGFQGKFINAFSYASGTELPLCDDEIRLRVAMQADGSVKSSKRVSFHLKKERKIQRLEQILNRLGLDYDKTKSYDGRWFISFHAEDLPKSFGLEYYSASIEQLSVMADECLLWDGDQISRYFTTDKQSAEVIQFAFAATGNRAEILATNDPHSDSERKTLYTVSKQEKSTSLLDSGRKSGNKTQIGKIIPENNRSYCFTMPSGMFIARCEDHIFVTGNCYGHNAFFKGNFLFRDWTQPDAIVDYAIFAKNYILECENKYGWEKVEETLDAAHTLEDHSIDKYKRPPSLSAAEEKALQEERIREREKDINHLWKVMPVKEGKTEEERKKFPSEPEENILYFIEKNSPVLEMWQREILRIVRKLAQYFYPQAQTKVMNEGYASFWHYTMLYRLWELGYLTDGFMQSFLNLHTAVVHQRDYNKGGLITGLNPYYIGFNTYREIERICKEPTEEDEQWFPQLAGKKEDWVKEIQNAAFNFKDESFILQYLTPRLMRKMRMFAILDDSGQDHYDVTAISNEDGYKNLRSTLSKHYNRAYRVPDVQVVEADIKGDRTLTLQHYAVDDVPLEEKSKTEVIKHIKVLWGFDVKIISDSKPTRPFDEDDYYVWI